MVCLFGVFCVYFDLSSRSSFLFLKIFVIYFYRFCYALQSFVFVLLITPMFSCIEALALCQAFLYSFFILFFFLFHYNNLQYSVSNSNSNSSRLVCRYIFIRMTRIRKIFLVFCCWVLFFGILTFYLISKSLCFFLEK